MALAARNTTPRVLALWAVLLVLTLALAEGFTFALGRYAQRMRENDPRTYLEAARLLLNQNDYTGAFGQAAEALRRQPDSPQPYELMGDIYYRLKNWQEAIENYERAIALGVTGHGPRLNTIWALIELKRYDEASAFGQGAIDQGFTNPAVPRYTAEALLRAERQTDAIPYLEKALVGYPNDLYLLERLRRVYTAAGQKEKAEEMRARAAEIHSSMDQMTQGVP